MRRLPPAVTPPARVVATVALATVAAAVTVTLAAGCATQVRAAGHRADAGTPGPSYYVSLGDSLAQGVQPDVAGHSVDTPDGYADQLYAALRRREPGLRLVKLGCPGETTGTMISGRHCPYRAGSQLAAATGFLRDHRGHVSLVTIDIGANDPNSCFTSPSLAKVPPCVGGPDAATTANLTHIMTSLRAAGGRRVTVIGMTLYDPELPDWDYGLAGRDAARRSERIAAAFNQKLAKVYRSFGVRVADVAGVFRSGDFGGQVRVPGLGTMPRNVAAVCRWTWICAAAPRGPNKHPNAAGYKVIARAFLSADH